MSTYLERAQLLTNQDFLARIGYSVKNFATSIVNEPANTPNHVARMNWALKALLDIPAMVATLATDVVRIGPVATNLVAVTDPDLQTVTEAAAVNLAAKPVAYADLMALAANPLFLQRLQVAVAKFAMSILNELPNTPNYAARYAWAKNTILNTTFIVQSLAPAIVVDATISTKLMGASDQEIQAAMDAIAPKLLL